MPAKQPHRIPSWPPFPAPSACSPSVPSPARSRLAWPPRRRRHGPLPSPWRSCAIPSISSPPWMPAGYWRSLRQTPAAYFGDLARERFELTPQPDGDLGQRMAGFFADPIRGRRHSGGPCRHRQPHAASGFHRAGLSRNWTPWTWCLGRRRRRLLPDRLGRPRAADLRRHRLGRRRVLHDTIARLPGLPSRRCCRRGTTWIPWTTGGRCAAISLPCAAPAARCRLHTAALAIERGTVMIPLRNADELPMDFAAALRAGADARLCLRGCGRRCQRPAGASRGAGGQRAAGLVRRGRQGTAGRATRSTPRTSLCAGRRWTR